MEQCTNKSIRSSSDLWQTCDCFANNPPMIHFLLVFSRRKTTAWQSSSSFVIPRDTQSSSYNLVGISFIVILAKEWQWCPLQCNPKHVYSEEKPTKLDRLPNKCTQDCSLNLWKLKKRLPSWYSRSPQRLLLR